MPNKYALMHFDTEINLNISNKPNIWVNYKTDYFDNGIDALYNYINSGDEAQLIIGETEQERDELINEMKNNYTDNNWLNNNVFI